MNKLRIFLALFVFSLLGACGDDTPAPSDAGDDAPPQDTGMACTENRDCDDGLFCTGEEQCVEGSCIAGTPVACDDGIECTIDACNEITARCESLAPDRDNDGVADERCLDLDGQPLGRDCDDDDNRRFGGNIEVCDAEHIDEDCDPETFGNTDSDADGYFDARCMNTADDGTVYRGDDCDDGRSDVNPASTEACDHVDNNCNGETDEGVLVQVAPDGDRDGFPAAGDTRMECPGFAGLIAVDDDTVFDCDDANPTRNPGQVEICDSADNDCDDEMDEAAAPVEWFRDLDGDGFGSRDSGVVISCEPVSDASLLNTDCDDNNSALNPAAAERCNGVDDDCNGVADFEIAPGDFEDDDGDGSADIGCGLPRGVDCDDQDARTAGGTRESCDGRDNDCDERVDEGADELQWFFDGDRDGHGTDANPANPPVVSCSPPPNYVGSAGDCDDTEPSRAPGALESCDGHDEDCDGAVDEAPAVCDCPDGFMNCEGDTMCRTNVWADPNNCGGCDIRCGDAPHVAFTLCVSGECQLLECEDGFSDCDPMMPGCETAIGTMENCGGCGDMCGAGTLCTGNRCECPGGRDACFGPDGSFCPDFANDTMNCGNCGVECPAGTTCNGGTCDCGFPEMFCDGTCINTQTSAMHCGGCFAPCGAGATCMDGRCDCPADRIHCPSPMGDVCADTQNDAMNCGNCGFVCGDGRACTAGRCDCPVGTEQCSPDSSCMDTSADPMNCGGCGIQCAIGASCTESICQCGGAMEQHCSVGDHFECIDTSSDPMNCGGCGHTCAPGLSCNTGICECGNPWETQCGDFCSDPLNDPFNCGSCGHRCPAGAGCTLGSCPTVVDFEVGPAHSCALLSDGGVVCWGDNQHGQVAWDNMDSVVSSPVLVSGLFGGVHAIRLGRTISCALSGPVGSRDLQCWGTNSANQLGDGLPLGNRNVASVATGDIRDFDVGAEHVCWVEHETGNNRVRCMGANNHGQLGMGMVTANFGTPQEVQVTGPMPLQASRVFLGTNFSCALQPIAGNFLLSCWGANAQLQAGQMAGGPEVTQANTLTPMPSFSGYVDTDFPEIRAAGGVSSMGDGFGHACVFAADSAFCWGPNGERQINGPPDATFLDPIDVTADIPFMMDDVRELSVAEDTTCVVTTADEIHCRGQGAYIIGDDIGSRETWSHVLNNVKRARCGADHCCAITTGDHLVCWGQGSQGRLGYASPSGDQPPRIVPGF